GVLDSSQSKGILVSGDFGSGKSHVLRYLQHVALEEGFACSSITVSKETSLADSVRVFRAAAAEIRVPGALGKGLGNVAAALRGAGAKRPTYLSFFEWAGSDEA